MFFYPDVKSRTAWSLATRNTDPDEMVYDLVGLSYVNKESDEEAVRIWLDFDSMTDYEIDIRIHAINASSDSHNVLVMSCVNYEVEWSVDGQKLVTTENNKQVVRYCFDAASAWNLMIQDGMSVSMQNGVWLASINTMVHSSSHKNPKRAVAALHIMKMYTERPELLFGIKK